MTLLYEDLTGEILSCYYLVYRTLSNRPGYSEINYARSLANELKLRGLSVSEQVHVVRRYRGSEVGSDFIDLLVENKVVIEVKKSTRIRPEHLHQAKTYLVDSGLAVGLVLNFGSAEPSFKRVYERANDPEAAC